MDTVIFSIPQEIRILKNNCNDILVVNATVIKVRILSGYFTIVNDSHPIPISASSGCIEVVFSNNTSLSNKIGFSVPFVYKNSNDQQYL